MGYAIAAATAGLTERSTPANSAQQWHGKDAGATRAQNDEGISEAWIMVGGDGLEPPTLSV